jgi:multidrug efflux pump subunit AcrA (membrane-fusion protein)
MATRKEIEDKLAAIDQKKAEALKALQAKRAKLKAQLAQLNRPSKSARRLDARRKILLGAFVLEQLERTGSSPQALTFEGKRFFDWLIRPNDRTVFETTANVASTSSSPGPEIPSSAPRIASTETPLNVPFADKDQAKALGALWLAYQKLWVVPAGRDLTPFATWLGSSA